MSKQVEAMECLKNIPLNLFGLRCTHLTCTLLVVQLLLLGGCSIERVPASISRNDIPADYPTVEAYTWLPLTESKHVLPNNFELRNKVHLPVVAEAFNMKFESKNSMGVHSYLDTNSGGAIYYFQCLVEDHMNMMYGRWCGWNEALTVPTINDLLPDDKGVIQIDSQGGILFEAWWSNKQDPKGLAFVFSGMGIGARQYSTVVLMNELLEDGWGVVHVFTSPIAPAFASKITLNTTSDPHRLAKEVIRLFDSKFIQLIGVTKAVNALLKRKVPSLESSPTTLIGLSAGALNVPAIYHSMKDQIDTVVLVAGGANLFRIVQSGAFTKWKFANGLGIKLKKDELRAVEEIYLATPSRDPYRLAHILPHDQTLLVHAKYDAVVPAATGDLLWERAGRPERWIFNGGHLGLFFTFGWHVDDIVQWIDAKVATPPTSELLYGAVPLDTQ